MMFTFTPEGHISSTPRHVIELKDFSGHSQQTSTNTTFVISPGKGNEYFPQMNGEVKAAS